MKQKVMGNKLKIFVINVVILCLLLVTAEAGFRLYGFKPGVIDRNPHFDEVDSLVVYNDFDADTFGIMKVHPEKRDTVNYLAQISREELKLAGVEHMEIEWQLKTLSIEHNRLFFKREESISEWPITKFEEFITEIKNQPQDSLTATDSVYLNYCLNPINQNGFRSIEFKHFNTNAIKVLLLGDSFTWGHDARPVINSFADLLSAMGYIVFNTGITGADPAQYQAIAEKYIPILKPDVVIVNYFIGNDKMFWKRKMAPYRNHYHVTNAGWMEAYPEEMPYLDAQDAYRFILENIHIPNQENNLLNRACAKTVLSTRLWVLFNKFGWVNDENAIRLKYKNQSNEFFDTPICEQYIDTIATVCDRFDSQMLLITIPEKIDVENPDIKLMSRIFSNTRFHMLEGFTQQDYSNGHFNNTGHSKYAAFLDSLIQASF